MRNNAIAQIVERLSAAYGDKHNHPSGNPLDVLVETILSQNTSDLNSGRAFKTLKSTFPDWPQVEAAAEKDIAAAIRIGGLEEIKAARIKTVLKRIREERGGLELDFLDGMPLFEARGWLTGLPGVGPKTANCVLLFAQGRPALPVDTHIFRVAKRLGLVDSRASVDKVHRQLEALVPPELVYRFHVLIIEHGRRTCKSQRPRCTECVLADMCPSYEAFTKTVN